MVPSPALPGGYFHAIVETVREPLLVLDADLRVRTANRAFYNTFGVQKDATEGEHLSRLGNGQWNIPRLVEVLGEVIPGGRVVEEYEVTHDFDRIGARTMMLNARSIQTPGADPALLLVAIEDVTERKRAQEERDRLMEELRRSNAELEQFAYVASHDLQEPLRMVASYTQLLARRYQGRLDEKADRFIGFAVEGATRMQTLINDLLAFSRVGTGDQPAAPTEAEAALAAALANLRASAAAAEARVTHDPLPVVRMVPTHLLQLFQNLVGNALKFRGANAPRVHVSARRDGGRWTFSVRDNGIGIAPEYADRVFVVFQRLHGRAEHPGTGIGLAICRKIVERTGGRIWVEPAEGGGSTFFFTLPAVEAP